jgi:putative PIN family toxin of toxin-antitoxin system
MRSVLDTNILVRATKRATGPARELLRYFQAEQHVLILSHAILGEVIRVLDYPRLRALHGLTPEECQQFVQSLHDAAEVVSVESISSDSISPDPDDNAVIQTAVQGKADVLCTLDRHLRREDVRDYCRQHGIQIMSDVELLEELRGTQSGKERE